MFLRRTQTRLIASTSLLLFAAAGTSPAFAADASDPPKPKTVDPLASLKIDHIMVHAVDYDASYRWYQEKLGFEPVVEWTVDGLDGVQLSYLQRNGFLIELVSAPQGERTAQLPRPSDFASHFAQRGFTHLCFLVDDVDATLAALADRGVPTFSGPIDFPALDVRVGFIQDPDGNVIEFKGPMAGNNVLDGVADWKIPQDAMASDEDRVREVVNRWISAWSPGNTTWQGETMRPLYTQGEDTLTVFDNVAGGVIELNSFDEYVAQWQPLMAPMRSFGIALERPAEITIDGDLAVVSFVFSGGENPTLDNAFRIRQFGTLVMERQPDGWRIIHEHLTADTLDQRAD
ncbi:MAG: VOC family protein [Planctomycetota bacterium]